MSLLLRVISSRFLASACLQRYAAVSTTRLLSSDSKDNSGKALNSRVSNLLSTLKQAPDKKVSLENVLQRSKRDKVQRAESSKSLKDLSLGNENTDETTATVENEKEGTETARTAGNAKSEASDTMSKMFEKASTKKKLVSPEMADKMKSILSTLKVDSRSNQLSRDIVDAAKTWGKINRSKMTIKDDFNMQTHSAPSFQSRVISFTSGEKFDLFDHVFDKTVPVFGHTTELNMLENQEMKVLEQQKALDQRNDFITLMEISDRQWTFPVDNEVVKVGEKDVGFEEHVFLGYLIDGFPQKGPVRKFMELVINGLEQNPHMTVEQKRNQVDWFKEYFDSVPEADLSF